MRPMLKDARDAAAIGRLTDGRYVGKLRRHVVCRCGHGASTRDVGVDIGRGCGASALFAGVNLGKELS